MTSPEDGRRPKTEEKRMTVTDERTQITTPRDEPVIIVRRFLAARPDLVFRAWSDPALLRRWWGPRRLEVVECELDSRVGGTWRIVHRAPDGTEFGFHGRILELDPPRRRVHTWVYEGASDDEAVETLELSAVEGGTMLTVTTRHVSVAARDQHVAAGMETGIVESYQRLDEVLEAQS
jgi:uncharacterized protein YndB with AHSA1/START domain